MRLIYTVCGIISLVFAILGVFLPVLPTTPLLLLAAWLFLRGNRNMYDWLMNHPRLGNYIRNFSIHKSIPLHAKIISVSLIWITLLNCVVFVAEHWALRIFFVVIAAAVTVHILSYKTMKQDTDSSDI